MGNDCSPDEREFRYMSFHQAIYVIENDIKKELDIPGDISEKKYYPFGLVNQGLCKKYKFLLNENFDKDEAKNTIFEYKYLIKRNEEKDFSYINPNFIFTFPSQYMFINKDFMDVIRDYIPEKYKTHLKTNFDTIIGGGCLIMKNPGDKKDENPFRYIILYNELKENKGNEIDLFLYIKDKKERNDAVNYILKYNLSNYFKKIDYNYKDDYKNISDFYYIVRCCEVSRIENYFSKKEQKKKEDIPEPNMINPNFQNQVLNSSINNSINNSIPKPNMINPNFQNNNFQNQILNNSINNSINNFNENFGQNFIPNDFNNEINISHNQNQFNMNNNNNNFQNIQMPMNMMNMNNMGINMNMDFNNMQFNNMNNNNIINMQNNLVNNNMNFPNLFEENIYLKKRNRQFVE